MVFDPSASGITFHTSCWVADPAFTPPTSGTALTTEQVPNIGTDGVASGVTPTMTGPIYQSAGASFNSVPILVFDKTIANGMEQVFAAPSTSAVKTIVGLLRFPEYHATRYAFHTTVDGADWNNGLALGFESTVGTLRIRHGTVGIFPGGGDTTPHLFALVGDDAGNERLYIDGSLVHSAALGAGAAAAMRIGSVADGLKTALEANWWALYEGDITEDANWSTLVTDALTYIGGTAGIPHPWQALVDALPNGTVDGVTGHVSWSTLDLTDAGTPIGASEVPLYIENKEYVRISGGGKGWSPDMTSVTDGVGVTIPARHPVVDASWPLTRAHVVVSGGHHVWLDGLNVIGSNLFVVTDPALELQAAFYVLDCDDCLIENSYVRGVYGDACYLAGGAKRVEFRWNDLFIIGRHGVAPAECFQCSAHDNRFFSVGGKVLSATPAGGGVEVWDFRFEHNQMLVEASTPLELVGDVLGDTVLSHNVAYFTGISLDGDCAGNVEMIGNIGRFPAGTVGTIGSSTGGTVLTIKRNVAAVEDAALAWQKVRATGNTIVQANNLTNSTVGVEGV